jgi:hypothetical protein
MDVSRNRYGQPYVYNVVVQTLCKSNHFGVAKFQKNEKVKVWPQAILNKPKPLK